MMNKRYLYESLLSCAQSPAGPLGPQNFVKLRLLGRGDVGKVYLVNLKGTDQLFAMKVLDKTEMKLRGKVERVITEREILASVDHPFLVSMFASFQSQKYVYLVMEYCSGGVLYSLLQSQPDKCIPEEAVQFYAAEVILALEYLHMNGCIYRDLKPENILVHESGHIMLADFDLSKMTTPVAPRIIKEAYYTLFGKLVQAEIGDYEPVERSHSIVGTEEYLAPEVLRGSGHSSAVDWWTLGILMYEMLYGITPFKGRDSNATFTNIATNKVHFPEKPQVSDHCKHCVKKLLKRDATQRLGHDGAHALKKHPFFKGIDWALIRNQRPPIIPEKMDPLKLRLMAMQLDDEEGYSDVGLLSPKQHDPFARFVSEQIVKKTTKGPGSVRSLSMADTLRSIA